jgi:ankyrin repeat protein
VHRQGLRLAGVWLVTLCWAANAATAAEPDVRIVEAAARQDTTAVRSLLKQRGVNVNVARADGATALLWAAHWNDLQTVDVLLKAGANVNAADDHGVTPLAQACENASTALVEKLLQAGANPNAVQESGLTPLMIGAHTGNVVIVKALLARGADIDAATKETKDRALMWAIADRHDNIFRSLIEAHADVHTANAKSFTPLMIAARNGDIEMAKVLIAAGVNVNETGPDGTSVLPFAINAGQAAFAMFLLEQGANPEGVMGGVRALHTAVGGAGGWLADWGRAHGGFGAVQMGGGGGGRNGNGRGGGMNPAARLALVKALLARGADPNARITTSSMFMNYIGYPKKGAFEPFSCGTGDLLGATPLWLAAYNANGSVGGFGGDGNQQQPTLELTVEADPQSTAIIQALLDAGADLRLTTVDGTTILMVAAGLGRCTFSPGLQRGRRSPSAEAAVTVLLDAGADINAVNEADFTALHGAAFRGLDEVIKILVDRGADINARDYRGRTAYRMAEGSKQSFQFQAYPETAQFIKGLGADTSLGIPGDLQERLRDATASAAQQQQ